MSVELAIAVAAVTAVGAVADVAAVAASRGMGVKEVGCWVLEPSAALDPWIGPYTS